MATLSDAEIAGVAKAAGIPDGKIGLAVAIALAESGGDPYSHNAIPPDDSYGLWQINMLGSMGPERRKAFGISSNSELYNPSVNARAMASLSSGGTRWGAWTTYTSGAYLRYLSRGNAVSGSSTAYVENASLPNPIDAFKSATKVVDTLSDVTWWRRVALFLFGAIFVYIGLNMIVRKNVDVSGAAQSVAKLVVK